MKKFHARSYVAGILTGVLILGLGIPTIASTIQKQLTATYKDIKICIDGNPITPKDANGNTVQPFICDGTTYLPIRAVGEAFGKDVTWDGETNSVYIGSMPDNLSKSTRKGDVLFEKSGIKATYVGMYRCTDNVLGGYEISVQIENTTKQDIVVGVNDFSVNGCMVNAVFSCTVAAGKKAISSIQISELDLDTYKIEVLQTAETKFIVYNKETWNSLFETTARKIIF